MGVDLRREYERRDCAALRPVVRSELPELWGGCVYGSLRRGASLGSTAVKRILVTMVVLAAPVGIVVGCGGPDVDSGRDATAESATDASAGSDPEPGADESPATGSDTGIDAICRRLAPAASLVWPSPSAVPGYDQLVAQERITKDVPNSVCSLDADGPNGDLDDWPGARALTYYPDSSPASDLVQCGEAIGSLGEAGLVAFCPGATGNDETMLFFDLAGTQMLLRFVEEGISDVSFEAATAALGVLMDVTPASGCCELAGVASRVSAGCDELHVPSVMFRADPVDLDGLSGSYGAAAAVVPDLAEDLQVLADAYRQLRDDLGQSPVPSDVFRNSQLVEQMLSRADVKAANDALFDYENRNC